MLSAAILVIFPLCLAYAALTDTLTMTIPNRVPLILLASFALIAPMTGMGLEQIGIHALAGLIVFAACFAFFALGVMGGGDAKLLTAATIWFGLSLDLFMFLTNVAIFGGLLTLLILILRGDYYAPVVGRIGMLSHLTNPKQGIPYGVAIGIAGLMQFPDTDFFRFAISHLA
jgi:prepilin peptidase CpaA